MFAATSKSQPPEWGQTTTTCMLISTKLETNDALHLVERNITNRWTRAEPAGLSSTTCSYRGRPPPRQLKRSVASFSMNEERHRSLIKQLVANARAIISYQ